VVEVRFLRALTALLAAALLAPTSAGALSLEPMGDYASPVYATSDPGNPDRLFVVEQDGRIQLTEGAATTEFLDIADIVRSPADVGGGTEEGLLSMALSPDYATDGLFYVFYTGTDSDLHIDEFTSNGDTADPATRREVLEINHPGQTNHNGGQLQFGPDGYLYASTGDGGGGGDPGENAEDIDSLLGKILRFDPAGAGDGDYSVPPTNPFADPAGCGAAVQDGCDEIWSYGLRNPWRFSFDRQTGALVIGDVGQGSWEEIDYEPASAGLGKGDNFGWDCYEGSHEFEADTDPACIGPTFTGPVFEYQQLNGNCAVTGGYVVRDASLGDLFGRYLYADFCVGDLRSLELGLPLASDDRSERLSVEFPSSFGEDLCGRIYVASRSGPVYRLAGDAPDHCAPPPPPTPGPPPGETQDTDPPDLELEAKRRQSIEGSRALRVRVQVDEAAEVELRAKDRGGKPQDLKLRDKAPGLEAGVEEQVKWKLSGREARRTRSGSSSPWAGPSARAS
jgi:glucose/arabinose dehydrogenase